MPETGSAKDDKLNVFISYSRDDLSFADQLDAALELLVFATALDRHGISGGEDWRRRLGALILDADTVVFVLSPASAASEICAWEVSEAARLGKRIIPVLCRPLDGVNPPSQLADLNYIHFYDEPKSPGSGFGTGQVRLVTALNTDLEWLREHTRLFQRATEWDRGGRLEIRLLSGSDIAAAKAWVARRPRDAPEPTTLHLDFIRASEQVDETRRNNERRRLEEITAAQAERAKALEEREIAQKREAVQSRRVVRRTLAGLVVALLLMVVAGAAGFLASSERDRARAALAQVFAERSWSALAAGNRDLAIRYSLSGWRVAPSNAVYYRAPLVQALISSVAPASSHQLHHGRLSALAASPDGTFLVSGGEDGKIVVLDTASGNLLREVPNAGNAIRALAVDPLGKRVMTVTNDATISILDAATGRALRKLVGHRDQIAAAVYSPDATRLATASYDRTILLWEVSTGRVLARLAGHTSSLTALEFSPDSARLVTGSADHTARVWDASSGIELGVLQHTDTVTSVAFGPDNRLVLTGSKDRSVIAWDAGNGFRASKKLSNHASGVRSISVGHDGSRAHVIDFAGNAYIWDLRNERIIVANASGFDQFGLASFDLGGRYAAIAGNDGSLRLWDSEAARIVMKLRVGIESPISVLLWSGRKLAVGDLSGALTIYDLANVALPIEKLAALACATERSLAPRFTWMEAATDPIIREVWDLQGTSRSVCE
ncbi:MAG TPA: TIR domain-containing protein [Xanthobacteraceae bacterium]|jgi:WD40 repeat protein